MSLLKKPLYVAMMVTALIGLTACASENRTVDASATTAYSAATQARIRLYGQNQKPTIMEYSQGNKKVSVNTGATLTGALLSVMGIPKNLSLGIPATDMSTHMHEYDGVLSKIYYEEHVIPINTPITIRNAFIALANHTNTPTQPAITAEYSCESDHITFSAEAGKDYEVVPAYNSAKCGIMVLEVK